MTRLGRMPPDRRWRVIVEGGRAASGMRNAAPSTPRGPCGRAGGAPGRGQCWARIASTIWLPMVKGTGFERGHRLLGKIMPDLLAGAHRAHLGSGQGEEVRGPARRTAPTEGCRAGRHRQEAKDRERGHRTCRWPDLTPTSASVSPAPIREAWRRPTATPKPFGCLESRCGGRGCQGGGRPSSSPSRGAGVQRVVQPLADEV